MLNERLNEWKEKTVMLEGCMPTFDANGMKRQKEIDVHLVVMIYGIQHISLNVCHIKH